ncbi:MAG: ATP-dependent sacrificial sulfur transferase LarE [Lachnospiraceae bacterium]|nr:ATP-dependent sacrificial sulfur transferase LarE [Lachnospiraceae bacterium]
MEVHINPTKEQLEKYDQLISYFESIGSVAVAFSSGVDSTFLLFAAKEALDDKAIAITASPVSFPKRELNESIEFCKDHGIRQEICEVDELKIEGFVENPKNRCYLCKKELFRRMLDITKANNLSELVEGSNLDDEGDYRPGLQAIKELGIKSPLRKIGFTKDDIRVLSKHLNIPTWGKPSLACLSTRFAYGETITKDKLLMVDKAEGLLLDLGFKQMRVRIHGTMARIEVMPEDFEKLISEEIRNTIIKSFKEYGFTYISLDLIGYRTGSMNEVLK